MADLLRCQLISVGGRTYRCYAHSGSVGKQPEYAEDGEGAGWRRPAYAEEEEEELEAADDGTIAAEGGGFVSKLDVDAELMPFIIGAKGKTKQRIEADTGARLHIPRRDAPGPAAGGSSQVMLRGESRSSVARALTQTELVISSTLASSRLEYNYFVSLPLATPAVRAAMEALKQQVLAEPGAASSGIEDSIFMKSAHLHLTLCMLKLYSEERRALARQVLQSLAPAAAEVLGGAPLRVQLKGLEYMNDDPSQMHVMYLGVRDPPGDPTALRRLRALCEAVVGVFAKAGLLLERDEREVKLHATVLNTRYRRQSQQQQQQPGGALAPQQGQAAGGGRGRFGDRQPFDGRLLLDKFSGADLGVVELGALHLSQRGKYRPDGFYACADALALA